MDPKNNYCVLFGELVRQFREQASLSQEDLADRAGIHRTYIGGIERGERNPTLQTIHKLAAALDIPPMELLNTTKASNR